MDEERKRKIEAGKSQWAKFKSRRNRSTKSSSPPDAVLSRVHEKNCPVDPGGILDKSEELHSPENSITQDLSLSNSSVTFENPIHPDKVTSDESGDSVSDKTIPVMESSSQHDISDTQSDLLANTSETLPKNQLRLESSSSIDSFTEGTVDESESSSGSDNSTITGISPNSSDSATENDFSEQLPPVIPDNVPELENYAIDPDKTDNRPDEEKVCTKVITKEQVVENSEIKEISECEENLLSVPVEVPLETSTEMKSYNIFNIGDQSKNASVMDTSVKDKSVVISEDVNISLQKLLSLTEADDEPMPLLNADEAELVSLFDKKIKKYQEAILQRDSIISKLSDRLETAVKANQAVNSAGNSQAETLREEINLLQLKMKETAVLLMKQKLKNGNLEFESCACQTDVVEICRCDTAVQVETSISSLLQTCDLDDISFIELLKNKYFIESELLPQNVQKLKELFLSHLPHVHIQEFMRSLKSGINIQKSEAVLEETNNASGDNELQCSEKVDSATILKKINSLNMVAKLIESLLSISSGGANDTFSDFSPSKFQSFFLKRLHSSETGDGLQDVSESESLLSDINYAEIDTPGSKPNIDSSLSLEKLRRKNIAEDFSLVTEFLQDEMDKLCSFIPSSPTLQRDAQSQEGIDCASETLETGAESEHQKILLHKSKLETRLKNLKSFDKELHDVQLFPHQLSIDSDTMTMSEDNLMKEEFPSCISLVSSIVSLTDSEYKTDNVMTDSETTYSRKVSVDMTRSMQEREFCIRCERNIDLLKEKYENEMLCIKESLEKSYNSQKNEFLGNIKSLESEINQLKTEKEKLDLDLKKQIELLHIENANKLKCLSEEHQKEQLELKSSKNKSDLDRIELETKLKELEEKLTYSNQKVRETLDEKANIEITLQMQIADIIGEHQQDMETMKLDYETKLNIEKKHFENNYKSSVEVLKKVHEDEINDLKCQIKQEFEEREKNLLNEHSKTISMIEAAHCDESAVYQKKIEQLLEEKCELLTKTTQEYETILKKNHRALVILCKQLLTKINAEKEKVINESLQSNDLDISFAVFDQLNKSLENGLVKFLNQNYFMNSNNEEFSPDDTEYLPIELGYPVDEEDMPLKIEMNDFVNSSRKEETLENKRQESPGKLGITPSESSLDSDDIYTIHTEINKLQEEFQKDVAFYKDVNDQLHLEIKTLRKQNQDLEEQKENLTSQLQEKVKELAAKESMLAAVDAASVNQAAQTNSRLLHVLSDLVKTFLDIEQDINAHLLEYGLIPTRTLAQHDDDTGQSIGSREDFTSLSLGECPNLELTEDGPDLTPRAWDVFITAGNYDTELEGEDVVLGASRRLRLAVDHVLNLLSRALENQQSQDLKLLLKRNEELSHELQEESQGRDAVHMELVTAESTLRKLESEKQKLEDLNRNLKDDYDLLKRELSVERSKVCHLQQEKESAFDEIHTLKEQCGLLASRLGDPEKKLLQENSRLSSEKHTVQKNLSKERQSFMDRLQQMELALEELNAEKDDLVEKKCKEIRDLKAEMEGMDKQLQSNRKFIEQQALEREQEREEFIKEITKMQDFVREKEKIQSTEAQMTKEIESLEQLLQARIEDHRNAMAKKDEVEKELRHSLDKIRDLREVIEELEKQLDLKNRVEVGLRQKLASACESIPNQDKNSSLSDSGDSSKNAHLNGESFEQLHNLKEQLASQSQEIEMMSQSQTLLHELRGQIHFLEAKVEQRARQLENSFLSAASSPVQSGATSPSGSQDSESLQIPCEDGWEMSPRSIHWLEVRRLEEKIGRLAHIDEELLKKNKELELQLKKLKASYTESQHENTVLQEKLSEQLMQISALKSHIDEQKHRCTTPQRSHSFAEKIEELQEELEKQIENNKRLISDLEEAQTTVSAVQDEIQKKNEIIAILQQCADRPNISEDESSDISAIEDLKMQLRDKIKLINRNAKENEELKSKNDYLKTENTSLKGLLEKAEKEVESERIRVENLCVEIANLTENSKRLEQDFNTVQDMMQQKERELATLHEETEAQMKLEAEIETLVQKLTDQKNLELQLREKVKELESQLDVCKEEIEKKDLFIKNLKESQGKEIVNLNKQIAVLKNFNTVKEKDFDVCEFVKRIMEVTDAFKSENGNESLHEVLNKLVQTSIGSIIKQLKQKHEDRVTSINASWQEKISQEIEQKQSYKTTVESLQKTFQSEKEKLSAEKDLFWQEKIKDVELKLKNEEMKYENLCDSAKVTRNELQAIFTAEINSLRQNLECALKEKVSLENVIKDLQNEVERLKQAENDQRVIVSSEYEAKLSAICKTIKESFEKDKQKVIVACQHKIDQLQKELDCKQEQYKSAELKHKEDLSGIHKYFETRWANEIKKVKDFQSEDLKKLKDSNDRILEDKLRKAKEEFSHLISEERKQVLIKHKCELEQQQEKFKQEKKMLLQMKEKAVKDATEILEKKFNENLAEIQKGLASSNQLKSAEGHSKKEWEEEKLKLISSHQKQIAALKQEMKNRYERQLQAQTATHNSEIKRLEESYNMKVEEVHDLIREAKRAASKTGYSDSGSNRTTTPSSDMTSSDEACSSCQEDMLSINKHILVDKIHQDGKRVLSLIESTAAPFSSVKEAHLWLEERKWIVNKLKTISPVASNASLKIIISDLVDEIQKFRMNFETALEENAELKQKHDDLEQELSIQYSKFCEVTVELKNQKAAYSELESLLSIKTSELAEVKKKLAEASRLAQVYAEKEAFSLDSRSIGSPSYEIGCARSADEPRSAEKFSMFLPDIDNTPSLEQKTPSNKLSQVPEISLPRIDVSTLISVQTSSPPDVMNTVENDVTKVKEKLMAVLNKGIDTTDAKLHGLYWVYRRSQSYNKALIYQKKYLLMLLRGFHITENATVAWLKHINKQIDTGKPSSPTNDSTVTDSSLSPRSRFRSAVFVMIALQRLKIYVRRWRLLARIPSSQVINVEIQSVFQNYSFLSPSISPGVYHLSSHSLASVPTSLAGREFRSSQMSTSSRAENKSKNSTNPDKSQLIEYVHRLEILQKQLGLDSLR